MSFIASVRGSVRLSCSEGRFPPPSATSPCLHAPSLIPVNSLSPPNQTPTLKSHDRDRESIVYIFGCLKEGCGGSRGSWRAFRWTQADTGTVGPAGEQSEGRSGDRCSVFDTDTIPEIPPPPSACTSSWGLEDGDPEDAFDLGDLSEQLKKLMTNPSNDKRTPKETTARPIAAKAQAGARNQAKKKPTASPVEAFEGRIPAFFLVHSADIPPIMDLDSDDEEDARYGSGAHAGVTGAHQQKTNRTPEGTEDEWAGEAYERDAVIRIGKQQNTSSSLENEAAFVAYMKELSRVPDQCLRVYGGGPGVPHAWPTKQPHLSSSCQRCGEPRRCAVQVMSPLIVAMAEGLEMMAEGHTGSSGMCGPPSSWDWATLAVSICSQSCVGDGDDLGRLIEEDVRVLGEA